MKNTNGTIILLNGPSASGKSSIQAALQKKLPSLYLKIGIDTFFDALIDTPDLSNFEAERKLIQNSNDGKLIRCVKLEFDSDNKQVVPLEIGPVGDNIIYGMHSAIQAYASKGNNVIVDYILYKRDWLRDLVYSLHGCKVYMIGIKAPLDILEIRELSRGTSPVGHARSHYNTVHQNMIYDLEIDVSKTFPEQSTDLIIDFMKQENHPKSLETLYKKFIANEIS